MAADHPSLESLWFDIRCLVSDQSHDKMVNGFIRNTKKSEKKIYEETMSIKGAAIHFPKKSLLAENEITGVWLSLSLDGQERPKRLPYGTQCCEIPVEELFDYLKQNPKNFNLEDFTNSVDERKEKKEKIGKTKGIETRLSEDGESTMYKRDPESNPGIENPKECNNRKTTKKEDKSKTEASFSTKRRKWKREDFLKDPDSREKKSPEIKTEGLVKKGEHVKEPLLFFETAYFFQQRAQYIRMVLISGWDCHVQWCKDNLYEIPLSNNPILQWKNGKLTSVSDIHPKLVVEVLVVGDIDLRMIKNTSWYTVRKCSRASKEPNLGVLEPIKYFSKQAQSKTCK